MSIYADYSADEQHYNILAVDGGGIRGIIPAATLEKIEEYAFEYASEQQYDFIPYYNVSGDGAPLRRLPMPLLFDMLAGTSTGSLLAAGLSMKNKSASVDGRDQPLYWANDAYHIYADNAHEIFRRKGLGGWVYVIVLICVTIAMGPCLWWCSRRKYDNPKKWRAFAEIQEYLDE